MSAERVIDADFEREVGAALLRWIATTVGGRWAGPRGALDYVQVSDGTTNALVRDFVAWATGHADAIQPGARERMEAFGHELLERVKSEGVAA